MSRRVNSDGDVDTHPRSESQREGARLAHLVGRPRRGVDQRADRLRLCDRLARDLVIDEERVNVRNTRGGSLITTIDRMLMDLRMRGYEAPAVPVPMTPAASDPELA